MILVLKNGNSYLVIISKDTKEKDKITVDYAVRNNVLFKECA